MPPHTRLIVTALITTAVWVTTASVARAEDCNANGIDDVCDLDCGPPGGVCDVPGCGQSPDCNLNGVPDECEPVFESQKLLSSDIESGDKLGYDADISGRFAVVGAPGDDDLGDGAGAAYVFDRVGGQWVTPLKLLPDEPAITPDTEFGRAVAVDRNRVLVGATYLDDFFLGLDVGAAYVFEHDGVQWSQRAKLFADDAIFENRLGNAVAIEGSTAVVAAKYHDLDLGGSCANGAGAVYLFELISGTWQQTQKLTAADPASSDSFGNSVDISGDRIVIGSPLDDDGGSASGSAYIFRRDSGFWVQEDKLTASNAGGFDFFGRDVAIDGDIAVVGAYSKGPGVVYVFRRNGSTWSEEAILLADDGQSGDSFGRSVAIQGDSIAIGANEVDDEHGAVYLFRRVGGQWTQVGKASAADGAWNDWLGFSIAIEGNRILSGAISHDAVGTNSGAAYVFAAFGADCNANGIDDACEQATPFDFDDNGTVDIADAASFASCLAGPTVWPAPNDPPCRLVCLDVFDADHDQSVTLKDFASFQAVYVP